MTLNKSNTCWELDHYLRPNCYRQNKIYCSKSFVFLMRLLSYSPSRSRMASRLSCWWSLFSCSPQSLRSLSTSLNSKTEFRRSFRWYNLALVIEQMMPFGNIELTDQGQEMWEKDFTLFTPFEESTPLKKGLVIIVTL